jgi:carbohydrate diacid regulator
MAQRSALLRTIRAAFGDHQDIVGAVASGRFVALHRTPSRRLADTHLDLRGRCRQLVEEIGQRHGLAARAGVGAAATSVASLRESYEDASTALRLGPLVDPAAAVYSVDDVRIFQLVATVSQRTRARFADATALALRAQPDWPVLRQTVVAWCESGFSLVRASAALHIHRNTLIYRLEKIAQLTGRSTRDHRGTLALYLACLADYLDDQ